MSYLDDFFDEQSEIIERFGWAVVHVVPTEDDPPDTVAFAYTVGLTGYGFPELTIAGLPPETGHVLLNEVAGRVCDEGLLLRHGHRLRGLLDGQEVRVVAGEITETLFPGAALMRYGDDRVRLLQLAWPDPADRFPWQSGYDALDYPQPTIGVPLTRAGRRCGVFRGVPGTHERRAQRHRAARAGRFHTSRPPSTPPSSTPPPSDPLPPTPPPSTSRVSTPPPSTGLSSTPQPSTPSPTTPPPPTSQPPASPPPTSQPPASPPPTSPPPASQPPTSPPFTPPPAPPSAGGEGSN